MDGTQMQLTASTAALALCAGGGAVLIAHWGLWGTASMKQSSHEKKKATLVGNHDWSLC